MKLNWFLRGLLLEEAGDGGGGGGVSDSGGEGGASTALATADAGGGDDGLVHSAEFTEEGTPQAEEPGTAVVKAGERFVTNGKVTASGRAALESLRSISPQLAQQTVQAHLTAEYFRREFPKGKADVQRLKQMATGYGGETGLASLKQNAEALTNLTNLYDAADPSFVDHLTADEESIAAFVKLFPSFMDRLYKASPDHAMHLTAQRFADFMDSARLPVSFARMADLLNMAAASKDDHARLAAMIPSMVESFNEISATLDKAYQIAKTKPADPAVTPQPANDERLKSLDQREQAIRQKEWDDQIYNERRTIWQNAWKELTKGRTISETQKSSILALYDARLLTMAKQAPGQPDYARFIATNDRDGYLRSQIEFAKKYIPEALRKSIQAFFPPAQPGPKPKSDGVKPVPVKPPVNGQAPPSQTVKVRAMPAVAQLDYMRTTPEMLRENKAFGKDGKIYQW